MKTESSAARTIVKALQKHPGLSLLLLLTILFSIGFSLLPPLVLERIIDTLAAGEQVLLSMAAGYFGIVAICGLLDAAKESLITVFGQKVTHLIRTVMTEKLNRLPASYFVEREPGVTASRFVNDVNTVDNLFSSGIISMATDLCKLISILIIIFTKSTGLGLLLLVITPLFFWLTRLFQKRMLSAQMQNRIAVGRTNQQIPETIRNMRIIRVLRREKYMLARYGDTIEQSYHAQERSNFYDAIYSPIVVSISSLLIGIVMAASAKSGTVQMFFGMSAGTAAAVIAYVGNYFGPLEGIGMEIQNIQSAAAGVRRINEFLQEPELQSGSEPVRSDSEPVKDGSEPVRGNQFRSEQAQSEQAQRSQSQSRQAQGETAVVQISHMDFRYRGQEQKLFHDFSLTVAEGESIILAGRTGAGKSTLVKLIAGLYQPQQGTVRVFDMTPDTIPEIEKRRWFGYVEQQFRMVPGTVGDQVSLFDSQVTGAQIKYALDMVGLGEAIRNYPEGIHTPCTESLFSQGQLQLLAIARAVVLNPRLLLLDEITANLDSQTEEIVLSALRAASKDRTVISVSHRLYNQEHDLHARLLTL